MFGDKTTHNKADEKAPGVGFLQRLGGALKRTRGRLTAGLSGLFARGGKVDGAMLEELEILLLSADVGIAATDRMLSGLQQRTAGAPALSAEELRDALQAEMLAVLQPVAVPLGTTTATGETFVLLMVGVNGAGKTTTIGKLAKQLIDGGMSVMLAAGDTFRAAAVEQLQTWGERNDVPVVSQGSGADSASVIFDALQSAKARGVDVLIADTAGRLHTQSNLMEELQKVKRVLSKLDETAPQETLIVLDGGTGQNALSQAEQFHQAMDLTGMVITKLDGTAKGGVVFAIAEKLKLPIRFIGVGEQVADLEVFEARRFVDALVEQ